MKCFRALLVCSFLIVAAIVAICTIDTKLISDYVSGHIIQLAASHGVTMSLGTVSPLLFGLKLTAVKAFIARSLLSIQLETSEFTCAPLQLLQGSAHCDLYASLYDGEAFGLIEATQSSGKLIRGTVSGVELAKHPQFAGLGIERGSLTLQAASLSWGANGITDGAGLVVVNNFSKPSESILPQKLTGLPMLITIPPISAERIKAEIKILSQQTNLESIEATTNFGSVTGSIRLSKGAIPDSELRITLTENGVQALKPHLQFICEASLLAPGAPLRIRTSRALGVQCSAN